MFPHPPPRYTYSFPVLHHQVFAVEQCLVADRSLVVLILSLLTLMALPLMGGGHRPLEATIPVCSASRSTMLTPLARTFLSTAKQGISAATVASSPLPSSRSCALLAWPVKQQFRHFEHRVVGCLGVDADGKFLASRRLSSCGLPYQFILLASISSRDFKVK